MDVLAVSLTGVLSVALAATAGVSYWQRQAWLRERQTSEAARQLEAQQQVALKGTIARLTTSIEALPCLLAAIQAAADPSAVAARLADGLAALLPDHHTLVLGLEPADRLVGLGGRGLPLRYIRRFSVVGPDGLVELAQRDIPTSLDDAAWRALGHLDLMIYLHRRVTAVPLQTGGRSCGLLLLSNGRPEPLPTLLLAQVQALAGAAASALAAQAPATTPPALPTAPSAPTISATATDSIAGLTQGLRDAFANVSALLGADQAINWVAVSVERTAEAAPIERTMLQIVAEALQRGLLADASTIHLWEDERLILRAHTDLPLPQLTALIHDPPAGIVEAAHTRRPVPGGALTATGHAAHLAVPILRRTDLLGVASVYWQVPHVVTSQDAALGLIFAGLGSLALDNVRLYDEMTRIVEGASAAVSDREAIVSQFLLALSTLADGRQLATAQHSRRVADYASAIARQLGLSGAQQAAIWAAALVHDIGYLGIGAARGTDLGTAHPLLGARFVADLPFLKGLEPLVLYHHERYDGGGFPAGLRGAAIPLGARILAVANAFDVLTSPAASHHVVPLPLPAQLPCSAAQALTLIQAAAGRVFDPQIVAALAVELTRPGRIRVA